MSKTPRLTFAVVADSNALFPKDPTKLVSGKFMAIWNECAKLANLRLLIPDIVRGERLYQLVCVAQHSLENAVKNFDTLAKVSESSMPPLPPIATIRGAIEKRFDEWAKTMAAETISVPYSNINWPHVVNDAIWRHAPFTPAGEGEDTEKGFRDCLILETLAGLVSLEATEQVIFVSGDRLLREAVLARFDSTLFAAYENLEGFLSYLKVTHTRMAEEEKQIAQKIIQAAPKAFYSADNPQCVYTSFNIYRRIQGQCADELSSLQRPQTPSGGGDEIFVSVSNEKLHIVSTQYEPSIAKNKTWGWKTRVQMVRVFQKQRPVRHRVSTDEEEQFAAILERLEKGREEIDKILSANQVVRIAPFDVLWTATCDNNAHFSRLKIVAIKPQPHEEEMGLFKSKYGFTDEEIKPTQGLS